LQAITAGIGIGMIINDGSLNKKAGISQRSIKKNRASKGWRPRILWGVMQGRQG
jgi:hypothetical protein